MARLKQICLYFLIAVMFISSVPIGVIAKPAEKLGRSILQNKKVDAKHLLLKYKIKIQLLLFFHFQ